MVLAIAGVQGEKVPVIFPDICVYWSYRGDSLTWEEQKHLKKFLRAGFGSAFCTARGEVDSSTFDPPHPPPSLNVSGSWAGSW